MQPLIKLRLLILIHTKPTLKETSMSTGRRKNTSEDQKQEVLAKIKQYEEKGFPEAGIIHDLIMAANPNLHPRLWYGMPGYAATKDSTVLCFFRKDALVTFGVTESAAIDRLREDSSFTASSWFITDLDELAKKMITQIVIDATS